MGRKVSVMRSPDGGGYDNFTKACQRNKISERIFGAISQRKVGYGKKNDIVVWASRNSRGKIVVKGKGNGKIGGNKGEFVWNGGNAGNTEHAESVSMRMSGKKKLNNSTDMILDQGYGAVLNAHFHQSNHDSRSRSTAFSSSLNNRNKIAQINAKYYTSSQKIKKH